MRVSALKTIFKTKAIDRENVKGSKEKLNDVQFIDRFHTSSYFHDQLNRYAPTCRLKR